MILSTLLALSPLIVILLLLIMRNMPADTAGLWGLILTLALAIGFFDTAWQILPPVLAAAVISSLPVGLVIAASIFQITLMIESGALARIIALVKTLTPGDKAVQVLLITVGIGTLLTGLGAASMAIFPPLLLALGYSVSASIVLASLGYVAMCMYALLGIPAVIMATFAGQGLMESGIALAAFMPVVATGVAFACLHVAGGFTLMRRGCIPALLTGLSSGFVAMGLARIGLLTVTAILAGMAVVIVLLLYVKLRGGQLRDTSLCTEQDKAAEAHLSLWRAFSPWLLLLSISLIINSPTLPIFDIVFRQWDMPVYIIPGSPERLRLFWQAYVWVIISTLCCVPLLKVSSTTLCNVWKKGAQRAWRPFLACAVYFAIGYVMNYSGTQGNWQLVEGNNIIFILAHSTTELFGAVYPAASPFLGLMAGFIGGSASSAVAMFTKFQIAAAESVNASSMTLVVANGIGGGLASATAPAKLLSAAASIDKPLAANAVIGYAFVLTCIVTALCALLAQLWAF